MGSILKSGGFEGFISMHQNNDPLFKNEVKAKSKMIKSVEYRKEIANNIIDKVAQDFLHCDVKKGKIKKARQLRQNFYAAISEKTHLKKDVIKSEIEKYVKEHPNEILQFAKEVSTMSGWDIDNITQDELLEFLQQSTVDMFSSLLGIQPNMKKCHLANIILAKICAEVFEINIHLHDVLFTYDADMEGGLCMEQISIDALCKKQGVPDLNMVQGFGVINSGMFTQDAETTYFHLEPRELSPHTPLP